FFDLNSSCPQPAQVKVPARFSKLSAQLPGRSVPCSRMMWNCSGVRILRHSASVWVTRYCLVSATVLMIVLPGQNDGICIKVVDKGQSATQATRHSGAERSEEPGIHTHNQLNTGAQSTNLPACDYGFRARRGAAPRNDS